ncbi:MAG TPA: glycosyltransferase N-terminal domain-containing protein [Chthoniobacterales bacterium]
MVRLIYNLLWPFGLVVFLPGYLVKMFRRGGYREKFGQRVGLYDRVVRQRLAGQRFTWMHAVSVGEVVIALKLARQLRNLEPDLACALTTTTTTAFAMARISAPPWMEVIYMPLDFWPIMTRAFAVIRPVRIVLVEAEVWPNLVARARKSRVPVALVNARLSPRSESRFRRFRPFVGPMFRELDFIAVPEREDVERWMALGVERTRIHHTGSIKYDPGDSSPGAKVPQQVFPVDAPVLFGGSTHRGEEEALARSFVELRRSFPSLCLFIAPRHVERAREIRKRLQDVGLAVRLVSERTAGESPDCVLLDKTGELQTWYSLATVAFVGKSLTAHGGQNPVEPIVAGVPVIFGPHMENFSTLARKLVEQKGAVEVADAASLERALHALLADPAARRTLVANAEQVLSEYRGATERTARLIAGLL